MTNEEAIFELDCNVNYTTPRIAQACRLASRSLEHEISIKDWLSTFNTDSATECFTAVQQLKRRLNNEQV